MLRLRGCQLSRTVHFKTLFSHYHGYMVYLRPLFWVFRYAISGWK